MTFSRTDIINDELVKEFFLAKNIRDSTKNHYIDRLRRYCNFIGKTPTQMIEEAENEEEQRLRMRKRKIRKYLISWFDKMRTDGYARNTINSQLTSVKTFYRSFEIELPQFNKTSSRDETKSFEKIPTKEDIKKALNYANLKYKAIILLMSSSGMGAAEIINLTYGNFLEAIEDYFKPSKDELFDIPLISEKLRKNGNIIPTWRIKRYKTRMPYITFSTPESMEALLLYMNQRLENYPINSLDDWIFLSEGVKMTSHTLSTYFRRLNKDAGFPKLEHSVFFHSHALRKFFGTTLYGKGVQRLNYDFMMGHRIDKLAEAYTKPNVELLKREYVRCLDDLSIESVKIRRIESEEVKNIVNELNKKDEEMEAMKKQMGVMEEMIKKMVKNQLNNDPEK
jgi:integrase